MNYTMKQAAEKMNISVHTLRFYANEGLFPMVSRDMNNVRHFTEGDLEWINLVQCLRDTGMGLADIKNYIDLCRIGDETISDRYKMLLRHRGVARKEMELMQQRMDHLEHKLEYYQNLLEQNGITPPEIELERVEAR